MTEPSPPTTQSIVRDDSMDDIVIEPLTERHFDTVRKIENEFVGANKGFCFGCCPYKWCPTTKDKFEVPYKKDPNRLATFGLAIRSSDQQVLGFCKTVHKTQYRTEFEEMIHIPKPNELYIDMLAVTKEARGKGLGTKLLNWAEGIAKERDFTILTLEVVNGNPAKRLYDRFGFDDASSTWFGAFFMLGRVHGQFGSTFMVKKL
jgi:ribosomal protein S18 acetylase RimI-like enzyme